MPRNLKANRLTKNSQQIEIKSYIALHNKKKLIDKKNNFLLAINFFLSRKYSSREKLSLTKFIFLLVFENMQKFDMSAYDFLKRKNISEKSIEKIFQIICIAIFNTNLKNIDARSYIFVLKKIIFVVSPVFFVPKIDLSSLFPNKAAKVILKNKGNIYLKKMIVGINEHSNKFNLKSGSGGS